MNSIEIKVTKSTMTVSNIYTLNQGEYNIDKCTFNFSEDYDDLIKKAIFVYNNEEPIEMVILDNECNIPYELLQVATEFTLKVYAYEVQDEELVQRYSPTPLKIFLREGSYQGSNEVITPSQFEQYEAKLNEGLEKVDDALDDVDEALQTMATATEETNRLNIDVSDKVGKDVTVTLTKKDNTTKSVVISDGDDFEYNWDGTKLGVKTDKEQEYQYVDLVGPQGPQGIQGEPFQIKKTYTTIQAMINDYDNMEINDYVMISGNIEQEDNAKLFVKAEEEDPTYRWVYLADFSGATGIQGPIGLTPNIQIGNVQTGDTSSVTRRGTDETPILDFTLEKGDKGDKGDTGNGIASIEKTSTSGLVDTYTITYDNDETTTYQVTNGADGNVTDVQVEGVSVVDNGVANITGLATQAELDRYKTIYNVLPKVSGEDETLTLSNTGEATLDLTLKGNTSQYSATKNKITFMNMTKGTSLNVTRKTNNSEFTLNGTTSSSGQLIPLAQDLKINLLAGTYTLTFKIKSGSYNLGTSGNDVAFYLRNDSANIKSQTLQFLNVDGTPIPQQFTLNEETPLYFYAYANASGIVLNNLVIQVQIEEGSSYTGFEQYGIITPTTPQPINVVSGDNEVVVCGKNLFTLDKFISNGYLDITNGNVATQTNPINKTYGTFMVVGGETYNVSFQATMRGFTICQYNSSGTFITGNEYSNTTNQSITLNANTRYLKISFNYDNTSMSDSLISDTLKPMLEANNQPSQYEPYQSQTYPINLGTLELCKIGDYQDYFTKNSLGQWCKYNAIGKVVLDGSENWGVGTYGTNSYYLDKNDMLYINNNIVVILSNLFKGVSYNDRATAGNNIIYPDTNENDIYIRNTSYESLANFKTFLASNNLIAYYVLATPYLSLIEDETLISQLDNIQNATSYEGTTNIGQVNNDKPFIIKGIALRDMQDYGETL